MNNEQILPNTLPVFFKLPFKSGTFILDLETLNKFSDFRIPKRPYFHIRTKKISFKGELWTLGVAINKQEEESVYIKVTATGLHIGCSVDTNETYLSRYAYCALYKLMYISDEYDFEDWYWPSLSSEKMQRKFLMTLRSRDSLHVVLKVRYHGLYKPGKYLPTFTQDVPEIRKQEYIIPESKPIDSNQVIGYCLSDTSFNSWHTKHYPFLVPYTAIPSKDKKIIRGFTKYVLTENDLPYSDLSPEQINLNEICFSMKAIALIKQAPYKAEDRTSTEIQKLNKENAVKMLKLWQQAFPLLQGRLYTHYHSTVGLRHVKGKPRKSDMIPCTFNNEVPELCFLWKEKADYYKLELRFILGGRMYELPRFFNTSFFVSTPNNRKNFYLLNSIMDGDVLAFFAETDYRMLFLKVHYEIYFEDFVKQLRKLYKFIKK